jgi:hypothetical protein
LYYGAAHSAKGNATNAWNLSLLPLQITTSTIVFNGETKQYSYLDVNPSYDYYLSGYARSTVNNDTGIIVYNAGYGSYDNDLAVFMLVSNIAGNLIYKVELSSDTPFDVDISYGDYSGVAATVSKDIFQVAGDWISFALQIATFVYDTVVSLFYWLKFFFWDNLGMTIALYLTVTMAFAARAAKGNIAKFLRTWFKDQVGLFRFIIGLWQSIVDLISSFRGIFRI